MTLAHSQRGREVAHVPDAAPTTHTTHVTDLQQWAQEAQASFQIAEMICGTEFCPQQYRGNPHKAAAAILAGSELGFSPMTALNAYDVIQGAVSLKARTMLAIVQSKGHYVRFVEKSPTRVVIEGHRKGQPEGLQTVEWTIERAQTAGYVQKNPNYKSKPQEMLTARAQAELCRGIASDALLGIAYSSEELQDDPNLGEPHPDERQGALPAPRAAARGGTSMSAADLTGDTTVDAAPVVEPVADQPRKATLADVKAAFDAADITDRAKVAQVISRLLDRDVTDLRTLTAADRDDILTQATELGADGLAALATDGQGYDPAAEHEALFSEDDS